MMMTRKERRRRKALLREEKTNKHNIMGNYISSCLQLVASSFAIDDDAAFSDENDDFFSLSLFCIFTQQSLIAYVLMHTLTLPICNQNMIYSRMEEKRKKYKRRKGEENKNILF